MMRRRWLGLSVIGLFFFMVVVDGSIVTIAVPAMARALAVGTAQVNLVISLYLIVISALLLPFGQLADRIGRPRLFRLGTAVFVLGSWLAGATTTFGWVLGGRVLQGCGASMTMATSYALVTDLFPPQELGRAFGIESIFLSLGALAGPGLGGLILAQWGWREIFWLNVPLGLLCWVAAGWALPANVVQQQKTRFDWLGTLGVLALAAGCYGLSVARQPGVLIGGLAVLALGAWAWVRLERRQAAPLLDPTLVAQPGLAVPLGAALLSFVAAYAFVLLAPLYLQLVVHLDARTTGLVLMAGPVVALVANPVAGAIMDRWGRWSLKVVGMAILLVAQLGMVGLSGAQEPGWLIALAVVTVVGTALFTTAANLRVMTVVAPGQRGAIGAVNSLARELGMMIGATLASGVFYGALTGLAGRPVSSALHQPVAALLTAQRAAYLVAAGLLGVALWLLLRRKKAEDGK